MGNFTYRPENNPNSNNQIPIEKLNRILVDEDVKALKLLLNNLSTKYNLTPEKLTKITEENIEIPLSVFSDESLSALESTVKYLKEELSLKFSNIGSILNRDERTIWATYHNSLKKSKKKSIVSDGISIPIKALCDRNYGILELLTGYLKEDCSMKFSEIGRLLKLDQRTVWTCYNRLKKKRGEKDEAR